MGKIKMHDKDSIKKIFFGGTILTMNDNQKKIEAIGIEGEKIVAVGKLDNVKTKMKTDYTLIDLKNKSLLPGFIDCHLHPLNYILHLLNPDLSNVKSLEELKSIMIRAALNRRSNELTIGFNFSEENFKEAVLPTKYDLDKAVPDKPIFILRYDGHIGIANTKALELAGIHKTTPIPEGGEIRKGKNGELNGIISEKALTLILSKISVPKQKEINIAADKAFNIFARNGITSLHGIINVGAIGEYGAFGKAEVSILKSILDCIHQNWYIMVTTDNPLDLKKLKQPPLDNNEKYGKFKLNCLKLFLDGSFGAKTACMYEPFTDAPGMCGFCTVDEEEIYSKMKIAHSERFQICIHAIGDKANRIAMNLYKRLLAEFPNKNARHRIEHASILRKDVLEDMEKFGIIASCQPPFINSEYFWLEKRLGKERCQYTYPMKSIINSGVILISGSDCPIEDTNVILGLHALVNRNNFIPEECISMEEALKTYTINAAYAAFEEDIKGSLEENKLADLVILDKNPLAVSKNKIKEIKVIETLIRGKTVFKLKENK